MPCVAEVVNRSLKADCTDFTNGGEVMVPRDNIALWRSTHYIIAFATQRESGHYKIFDG